MVCIGSIVLFIFHSRDQTLPIHLVSQNCTVVYNNRHIGTSSSHRCTCRYCICYRLGNIFDCSVDIRSRVLYKQLGRGLYCMNLRRKHTDHIGGKGLKKSCFWLIGYRYNGNLILAYKQSAGFLWCFTYST